MMLKGYLANGTIVGNAHYQRDGFHAERGATFGFAIEGEHRKEPMLLAPAWGVGFGLEVQTSIVVTMPGASFKVAFRNLPDGPQLSASS
jgi:hypothetical protein